MQQINATGGKLGVMCAPPEAEGTAAPCLMESFFHLPEGFEEMDEATLAGRWADKGRDVYGQCRLRTRDADWPTAELFETRTAATKTMRDFSTVLKKRVITFVGASVMRGTVAALQCGLESAGLRRGPAGDYQHQLRLWGWATFSEDNHQCSPDVWNYVRKGNESMPGALSSKWYRRADRVAAASCVSDGDKFRSMLAHTDVVVVGYNPQHYEGLENWWELDLKMMLPILSKWAETPGKVAIVREPPAQHFAGGAFSRDGHGSVQFISGYLGCCPEISATKAYDNYNWRAVQAVNREVGRFANVHVLPWYNATLRRWSAHIGTRADCFSRAPDLHGAKRWARKGCGCDCTHYCYTPLFYDSTIITPMVSMLKHELRGDRDGRAPAGKPAPARAKGQGG